MIVLIITPLLAGIVGLLAYEVQGRLRTELRAPAKGDVMPSREVCRSHRSPSRLALRSINLLVRVLPDDEDRQIHREDFERGLYDLAEAGGARWRHGVRQVTYVLRAARGLWALRRVLREPGSRRQTS